MSKTALTTTDLEKGLKKLEAVANAPSRRRELFMKADAGTITAEENEELVKSLSGSALASEVTQGIRTNDTIQKAESMDVSEYIREVNRELLGGMEKMAKAVETNTTGDQSFRADLADFMVHLAKSVQAQGELLKGIGDRLGGLEKLPVGGPKSRGAAPGGTPPTGTVEKSFAGGPGGDDLLKSKNGVLDVFEDMIKANPSAAIGGELLVDAAAKFESLNQISPVVLQAVRQHAIGNRAA